VVIDRRVLLVQRNAPNYQTAKTTDFLPIATQSISKKSLSLLSFQVRL